MVKKPPRWLVITGALAGLMIGLVSGMFERDIPEKDQDRLEWDQSRLPQEAVPW